MGLLDLAIPYAVVGAGCAVAALAGGRALDALLLLPLWPLYGPFALARWTSDRRPAPAASPLAVLLPDADSMAALHRRVEDGRRRIAEIASLLDRPEFRVEEAEARLARLEAGGAPAALARSRVDNIRRLGALKNRFERELEEVTELLIQLAAQAEVVRLVGAQEPAARELVRELTARVEGLDHMLAEEVEDPAWAIRSTSSSSTTRPTSER